MIPGEDSFIFWFFGALLLFGFIGICTAPVFERKKKAQAAGSDRGISDGLEFAKKENRVPNALELDTLAAAKCPQGVTDIVEWKTGYRAGFEQSFRLIHAKAFKV